MNLNYTITEAKSKFSEVLRHVREGNVVTISYRGNPVAEMHPIPQEQQTLEERYNDLKQRGIIKSAVKHPKPFRLLARRPGAVERFLQDRNE